MFAPLIAARGLTVTVTVRTHPLVGVNVMTVVPATNPVTIPVAEPTLPAVGLLLLHVPPVVASVRVVLPPTHTLAVPLITPGNAFTVTTVVILQPVLIA